LERPVTRDPAILRSPSGHGLGKALGSKKASISLLVVLTAGVRVDNMARLEKYYIRVSTQTLGIIDSKNHCFHPEADI
jgi:hypothetical protein